MIGEQTDCMAAAMQFPIFREKRRPEEKTEFKVLDKIDICMGMVYNRR